jgi:hypothetical protein
VDGDSRDCESFALIAQETLFGQPAFPPTALMKKVAIGGWPAILLDISAAVKQIIR